MNVVFTTDVIAIKQDIILDIAFSRYDAISCGCLYNHRKNIDRRNESFIKNTPEMYGNTLSANQYALIQITVINWSCHHTVIKVI